MPHAVQLLPVVVRPPGVSLLGMFPRELLTFQGVGVELGGRKIKLGRRLRLGFNSFSRKFKLGRFMLRSAVMRALMSCGAQKVFAQTTAALHGKSASRIDWHGSLVAR